MTGATGRSESQIPSKPLASMASENTNRSPSDDEALPGATANRIFI